MSKPIKTMITEEIKARFDGVNSACVIDMSGMGVIEQETLRGALREKSARVQVVKNSLAKRAFKDTVLEPLANVLEGPCALVVSEESVIDSAKTLVEVSKEIETLTLKHAIFEGDPEILTVIDVSKMKGRLELLGEIAMLVGSPGRAVAGCLKAPQSKVAGCLKAIIDKAA